MVLGIGTDIVSVSRIQAAVERTGGRFLWRVFTEAERDCCRARRDPYECFAARFAAKEAVLKALGTGLAGCRWQDIEILPGDGGRPLGRRTGGAARGAAAGGAERVLVSLAHERGRALAFAVALGPGGALFE